MINDVHLKMIQIIKASIWGGDYPLEIDAQIYDELKNHALLTLPADILSKINMSKSIENLMRMALYRQIAYYTNYVRFQEKLPITVPYVILKGVTASQYYPHPEYRAMGDIDIMTRHEDFNKAYQELIDDGYRVYEKHDREIAFIKNVMMVELHCSFASLNNADASRYLDELIINNINNEHVLPDNVNGLVLLEHIGQHLEHGLGLRQIIDWMMYVDKCLPDDKWPEFQAIAQRVGLKKLAVVSTRMCELYLGLSPRAWCAEANVGLCEQLFEYVLACGNFGNKKTTTEAISENVFAHTNTPKTTLKLLQNRGLHNWKAAQKHKALRPLAWVYQAIRYIGKGLNREDSKAKLKKEYKAARRRNAMFDALGVKTADKGIFVYKDGLYTKK